MRKIVLISVCLLMLASVTLVGLGCSEDDEAEVTWRFATYTMTGETNTEILQYFADEVNEKSDGRMEIKIFPGGTLHSGADILDAVISGNVDLGFIIGTWLGNKMPKHAAIYPQQWGNDLEERLLIDQAVYTECDPIVQEGQANNVVSLWNMPGGDIQWMFDRSVELKEDVAGLHLWCAGDAASAVVEAFGATPFVSDITAVYTAAQTGTIDGMCFMSIDIYNQQKLYEVMPYVVLGGGIVAGSPVLMNIDSFEALPEDLQEIVQDTASDAFDYGMTAYNADLQVAMDELEANPDVHIYELPDSEAVHWQEETIYPLMEYAMYLNLTQDEIAQVMTVVATTEANF